MKTTLKEAKSEAKKKRKQFTRIHRDSLIILKLTDPFISELKFEFLQVYQGEVTREGVRKAATTEDHTKYLEKLNSDEEVSKSWNQFISYVVTQCGQVLKRALDTARSNADVDLIILKECFAEMFDNLIQSTILKNVAMYDLDLHRLDLTKAVQDKDVTTTLKKFSENGGEVPDHVYLLLLDRFSIKRDGPDNDIPIWSNFLDAEKNEDDIEKMHTAAWQHDTALATDTAMRVFDLAVYAPVIVH